MERLPRPTTKVMSLTETYQNPNYKKKCPKCGKEGVCDGTFFCDCGEKYMHTKGYWESRTGARIILYQCGKCKDVKIVLADPLVADKEKVEKKTIERTYRFRGEDCVCVCA